MTERILPIIDENGNNLIAELQKALKILRPEPDLFKLRFLPVDIFFIVACLEAAIARIDREQTDQ